MKTQTAAEKITLLYQRPGTELRTHGNPMYAVAYRGKKIVAFGAAAVALKIEQNREETYSNDNH